MTGAHSVYHQGYRDREAQQRVADADAAVDARATAERLVRYLVGAYEVSRVVLIGSLARGEFRVGSDIDLVVGGLPPGQLFRAGADLEGLAAGISVDLIPIETARPLLRQVVAAEGVELYRRG